MNRLFLLNVYLLSCLWLGAQTQCTVQNRSICDAELVRIQDLSLQSLPINEVAVAVGTHFMGVPYVAHTLEVDGEPLVVELSGLDCTTFLENIVVFARLAKKKTTDFEDFTQELEHVRYRSGERNTYSSRLHYFTEWIYDNEQKGIIRDITKEIGGKPYPKKLDFMSTHRDSYQQLANDHYYEAIKANEAVLNTRTLSYIPREELQSLEKKLKDGDLVAITTTIKGLDVLHVGMVKWQNERVHLFHASSKNKRVEISAVPLADYLMASKIRSGIIACRLQEP